MFERDDVMFSWPEQIDPAHSALVMVDLQNDFVHPDGWVASQQVPGFMGDTGIMSALQRAEALLGSARKHGVPTIFVRMLGDDHYLSGPLLAQYRRNHGHERPACVQEGTWGADWHPSVAPDGRDGEFIVDKHRYSAFIGTRLDLLLRSHGVRTIVVCGVASSGCVESTIRDGFMLDYYVVIAGDACGDYDAARHQATLTKMDLSFGAVVGVDDIRHVWDQSVGGRAVRDPSSSGAEASTQSAIA